MLTREDVERIIDNRINEKELISINDLRNRLELDIKQDNWADPNTRIIILKFGDRIISEISFNV